MIGQNLKIHTLKKRKWSDKDYVMLHACFQLLVDCVEQEVMPNDPLGWFLTEKEYLKDEEEHVIPMLKEHWAAHSELVRLYNWWKEVNAEGYEFPGKPEDVERPECFIERDKSKNYYYHSNCQCDGCKAYRKHCSDFCEWDRAVQKLVEDNFQSLIKLKGHLAI